MPNRLYRLLTDEGGPPKVLCTRMYPDGDPQRRITARMEINQAKRRWSSLGFDNLWVEDEDE
jgi:hypothetical protein